MSRYVIVNGRVFRGFLPGRPVPRGSAPGPRPPGAPTAVGIEGDRIAFVGEDTAARAAMRRPTAEEIDARGGIIMAGFEDAHIHLQDGAHALDRVDLAEAQSLVAVEETLRAYATANAGRTWILGRGWSYEVFPGGLPTRAQLDAAVRDRPALITSFDGHVGWANTAGLAALDVTSATPDPPAGRIDRDPATGEPTGILREEAFWTIYHARVPAPTPAEDIDSLRRTIPALHAAGITSVQDAWVETSEVGLFAALLEDGALSLRTRIALPMRPPASAQEWRVTLGEYHEISRGLTGPRLSTGIVKAFADGVIEAKTAVLLEPYANDSTRGLPNWDPGQLDDAVRRATEQGWQVQVHAVGDGAVRMALDAFERAADARPPGLPPHRIEHIETVARTDIGRFAALSVVACMQPVHATPGRGKRLFIDHLGEERAARAWAWRSILRSGGVVAFGSDWPVRTFDPLAALHLAVTREAPGGDPPGGWLPRERLSVAEALSAATLGSARAGGAEHSRGTLEVGRSADVVVLDRDLLSEGPSAILGARVVLTIAGGEIVHRPASP